MPKYEQHPVEDCIFAELHEKLNRSNIIKLHGTADEQMNVEIYKVIKVGPGRINERGDLIPMRSKVGDLVIIRGGNPIDALVDLDALDDAVPKTVICRENRIYLRVTEDPELAR